MANELQTVGATGSLTHVSIKAVAGITRSIRDEQDLTDEQFEIVKAGAQMPMVYPEPATEKQFKAAMAALSGTLKARRTSDGEGAFALAVYQRILGHLPNGALVQAVTKILKECEWMPTPAEILKASEGYRVPQNDVIEDARRLVSQRTQRKFSATMIEIDLKQFPEDELSTLPSKWLRVAEARGRILFLGDVPRYRTKETVAEWMQGD